MIEPTPRAADLEAGLAEIDRRLRQIQEELLGGEPPPDPPSSPGAKSPGRAGPLAAVLQRAARAAPPPGDEAPSGADRDAARRVQDARTQLDDLERQLHALADLRDKLLASIRQLVDGYQAAAQVQPGASVHAGDDPAGHGAAELTVSAGPFASLEAVRSFQRALATLPGVRETSVRGYEGADRAIVDVRLAQTGSKAPNEPTS